METPHKKTLSQAHCWSPEGKASRPDNKNWSIKPKKFRGLMTKNWVSKLDEYKQEFIRRSIKYTK